MRIAVVSAILLICITHVLPAQSLRLFDVDVSAFPILKAKFHAFDADGYQARPSPSEVRLMEDGSPRTVVSITCPEGQTRALLSIAMSLDISGSMTSAGGGVPIEFGKSTLRTLLDNITSTASEIAFQTCNTQALIRHDFTTNRQTIRNAVDAVGANGGTDLAEQLLNPQSGVLHLASTGKYKRVAVLYTDAWHIALSPEDLQRCIDLCSEHQIEFYAIIYTRPEADVNGVRVSLKKLAEATGGAFYDGITSHEAAREIAHTLQNEAEMSAPCEIRWQSGPSCTRGIRNIELAWKSLSATARYSVTDAMLGELHFDPPFLYMRPVKPGERVDTTVSVTAVNSSATISNITSSHPAYTIAPTSFTLAAGESRTLTVSYQPRDSGYSWAEFDIVSDLCRYTYNASGRFPGTRPEKRTLVLETPNGGEELVVGSDTLIRWKGIPATDTVRLEYSIDNGTTWRIISRGTTGPEYMWHVPKQPNTTSLVRVTQLVPGDDMTLTLRGHSGPVNAVAWSPNGSRVATAGEDNTARIWDAENGRPLVTLHGHGERVMNLAWSPDGSRLATASLDHTARVWDAMTGAPLLTLDAGGWNGWTVDWSPDGQKLATGGALVGKVWNANSGAELATLNGTIDAIDLISWSPDGKRLLTSGLVGVGGSETARIWNQSNVILHSLAGKSALWSPDGNMVATISDRQVLLWNSHTGAQIRTLAAHTNLVIAMAWSPDAKSLVTASTDNSAIVWDVQFGARLLTLPGNSDRITGVAWSPDGGMIATPGATSIRIWDAATGLQIENLSKHDDRILGFEWSPDGNRIASGSIDETAKIWHVGPAPVQSDTSDALFSIVMPVPTALDIDMGTATVNKVKDSLIQVFVGNAGSYLFNVVDISIVGPGASQFSIESGRAPYTLPVGGGHSAEFRFRPTSVGAKSATIRIITQADTLFRTIRGEGIASQLEVMGDVIDFGQMELGMSRDTLLPIAIRNTGIVPVRFSGATMLGPDSEQFSILSGDGAFDLAPGESRAVTLRFAPRYIGRTSGRVGFEYDGPGSPAIITLFGRGVGGMVYLPNDSAEPGAYIRLPLRLEGKVTGGTLQSQINRYRATVSYNTTILSIDTAVSSRSISQGREIATFDGSWSGGSELGHIPFRSGLGNSVSTDVVIEKFEWLGDDGAPLDIDVDRKSGSFKLLELCFDGGARLVDPSGQVSLKLRGANPVSGFAEIEVELLEEGETELYVTDLQGRIVGALEEKVPGAGVTIVSFDTGMLATGTYFLVLQTPTISRTLRLEVRH